MTNEQGFRFITRGLSFFCILSALIPLSYLPPDAMDATHYWHMSHSPDLSATMLVIETHSFRQYLLRLADSTLLITTLLWAAGWFYRGGAFLQRFFMNQDEPQ